MRYNKSCDDMRLVKEVGNGEESEVDEYGNKLEKYKAMEV